MTQCTVPPIRHKLTLEERVQVIQAYEKNPVYQRIAETFQCSPKQIKNIIADKEGLLREYKNQIRGDNTDDLRLRRQEKIEFLDRVIYEYLQRAAYHNVPVDSNKVLQKARQISDSIAIKNFYPNDFWLYHFISQNKLSDFNTATLRLCLPIDEPKNVSLKSIDLIQFVSARERAENQVKQAREIVQSAEYGSTQRQFTGMEMNTRLVDYGRETVCVSNEPIEGDEMKPIIKMEYENERAEIAAENKLDENHSSLETLPTPQGLEQAIQHLKALEDYAMLSENYRAIGLITQLEEALKNPPKHDDFEI